MKSEFHAIRTCLLFVMALTGFECAAAPRCVFVQRTIAVDGDMKDWDGIKPNVVQGREHLWFGQGMTPAQWSGDADLSYQWRGAWSGDQLYFAIEVTDDRVVKPDQASSFLCDCVEIYLDCNNQGGRRVKVLDGREDWLANYDPHELMGYELHFLATDPPRVYLDHADKYALDKPQTERFKREWAGNAAFRKTAKGYLIEVGFRVPGVSLSAGKTVGVEIGVCDDDGKCRESIMMWTGTKGDFWITMDDYDKATLIAPPKLQSRRNADSSWGIVMAGAGLASAEQPRPLQVEIWDDPKNSVRSLAGGYASLFEEKNGFTGKGCLTLDGGVSFEFKDRWSFDGDTLHLNRTVSVHGNAAGGFLTAATLAVTKQQSWSQVEWFAPGMIYGGFEHMSDAAIGGHSYYKPGDYTVRIREDRLPAPVLAGRFSDSTTLAVLNTSPKAGTTAAEALSVTPGVMTDARFGFGAIGGQESGSGLSLGYWFPGSEGEETYAGNTYPGGQIHEWRRRFHPIRDGFEQHYEVAFRFGRADGLAACCNEAWRWAWRTLKPQVNPQDIPVARCCIVDALAANVIENSDRAGISGAKSAVSGVPDSTDRQTLMGFTGKALEAAEFMLAESLLDKTERGTELRRKAEKIIASFLRLKMSPPEAEGFIIKSGKLATAMGYRKDHPEIYLRSFGDDVKALLRAYERERQNGRPHPDWLEWARQFADWLLTQQQSDGGFPRSWVRGTGEVFSDSPNSSFNAIPLLVQMNRISGDRKYLKAAIRAGDFCWANGQAQGKFVGGTIDNPDTIDKEAATLSLEGFLMLYETTNERKWLERAQVAANIAETWIYIWNVPMPADADDAQLHWKRGVPTTGLQLIAAGHSLVDAYMSFDADEYAQLYRHTGDEHYLYVARILLHNTKAMVALPGRTYDLRGPGWQQEHYSLAPKRGMGLHRLWLPWVATSQLNGIFGLMDFDEALFEQLAAVKASTKSDSSQNFYPNIVLPLADDLDFSDSGCYGGEIRTPNIDAQAGRGGIEKERIRATQARKQSCDGPNRRQHWKQGNGFFHAGVQVVRADPPDI